MQVLMLMMTMRLRQDDRPQKEGDNSDVRRHDVDNSKVSKEGEEPVGSM
jgi:hypothetical protein